MTFEEKIETLNEATIHDKLNELREHEKIAYGFGVDEIVQRYFEISISTIEEGIRVKNCIIMSEEEKDLIDQIVELRNRFAEEHSELISKVKDYHKRQLIKKLRSAI